MRLGADILDLEHMRPRHELAFCNLNDVLAHGEGGDGFWFGQVGGHLAGHVEDNRFLRRRRIITPGDPLTRWQVEDDLR